MKVRYFDCTRRGASRNFVTGCLIRDVTEPDVWLSPDLVVNRKAEGEEAMLTQVGAGNISAEAMTPRRVTFFLRQCARPFWDVHGKVVQLEKGEYE